MTSPRIRAWVFSDLHQEHSQNAWDPAAHAPAGGFDVAVVAGDVHTPLTRSLEWLAERLPGVPVVYVPGNHDFWWDRGEERYTLADQMSQGRDIAAHLGIHLLMDDAVVIGGTRFAGGTLWTDFRLGSFSLTHAMRTAQGRSGMVDYRRIRTGPSSRHRIEPGEVLAMHRRTRAFLDATLAEPHPGPTVVVTHHAPHPDSLPDPLADLRWCYASDLRDLIHARGPDLWVHGHIHAAADYIVGPTRIVCNPRGHPEETTKFGPLGVITPGA
ncbi:metallophosphoesterase [Methylobacterium radiotolerans]|uniref:metallophosphoesterase n=1 Tax=Methylobacterium radiotolerans TaxID=31998 RepID=UPI000D5F6310|nr:MULTISPECIES: metallophosphoesterase [Methylobacterium]MDE3749583.1 metallophosphoesterase [Methylobacterium radiotolerans]PVZ05936.1 Icc-related predicted phosphoesterase [Methylobacterium organophilum]